MIKTKIVLRDANGSSNYENIKDSIAIMIKLTFSVVVVQIPMLLFRFLCCI